MVKVNIKPIHAQPSSKQLAYVEKKCNKFFHFYDRMTRVDVMLKEENSSSNNKLVEIKVMVPGETIIAKENANSFEAATDLCTDKVIAQLKKFKQKQSGHH